MNVAVVDDQDASLAGFTQILRRLAHMEPVCFKKGNEALHWLSAMEPIFVVVNQTLADMAGVDMVRRFRVLPGRQTTPVLFTTAARGDRDLRRAAFELDIFAYLEKPINPSEFLMHATHLVDIHRERADLRTRLAELSQRSAISAQSQTPIDEDQCAIQAMLDVASLHDPSIVEHLNLSAQLTLALATEMKLTAEELQTLSQAARIYDIGKVAIPQRILESRAPAGSSDRSTIEGHATAGASILATRQTPVMRAAATIARTHHERYDGAGYPRKLRGTNIPIFGRLVAVADALAALLETRAHRPAHSLAKAIEIIEAQSGSAFDPNVVQSVRGALAEISRIVHEHFRAAS